MNKKLLGLVALCSFSVLSTSMAFAQKISCSTKSGKAFLTANLKVVNTQKIYLESIQVLSSKESTTLAKSSVARDIENSDYNSYRFRAAPSSLYLVDPEASTGLFDVFSSKPRGSDEYIGEGRKWVIQYHSAEFQPMNTVSFSFDYQNALSKKAFKLKAWHDEDEYYVHMEQKLV